MALQSQYSKDSKGESSKTGSARKGDYSKQEGQYRNKSGPEEFVIYEGRNAYNLDDDTGE